MALFSALALAVVGCTSADRPAQCTGSVAMQVLAPAAALAFESPSAPPSAALARELREPEAYLGYEMQTTTFSYTRYDDRVRFDQGTGSFERRAMGERTGVTVR